MSQISLRQADPADWPAVEALLKAHRLPIEGANPDGNKPCATRGVEQHTARQKSADEEKRGVNNVLNAAALTYVAGLVTAILQLLYYVTLVGGGMQAFVSGRFGRAGGDLGRRRCCHHPRNKQQ